MKFLNFNEWKTLKESRKDELKCPHPKDKKYCQEWNRWIRGEIDSMPVYQGKTSTGHWEGRRGGEAPTKKSVMKRKQIEGRGRYKDSWKKD